MCCAMPCSTLLLRAGCAVLCCAVLCTVLLCVLCCAVMYAVLCAPYRSVSLFVRIHTSTSRMSIHSFLPMQPPCIYCLVRACVRACECVLHCLVCVVPFRFAASARPTECVGRSGFDLDSQVHVVGRPVCTSHTATTISTTSSPP